MGPTTIETPGLPVLSWASELEEGALRQAVNCAELSVAAHHVAVMADGHQGYGVPIGAVLALDGAISPFAVGNDIGCGMVLVPTQLTRADLLAPAPSPGRGSGRPARSEIMGQVRSSIPAGAGGDGVRSGDTSDVDGLLEVAMNALEEAAAICGMSLSSSQSPIRGPGQPLARAQFVRRGRAQAGTLGGGNHFIELLCGPDGDAWIMLHSGSRGVGGLVCTNFHLMALAHCAEVGHVLPDPGLAWLPVDPGDGRWAAVGQCYERALRSALGYAERNRRRMLETVGRIIDRWFPQAVDWQGLVDIHHNDATLEEHYGRPLWVHRKGAVKAAEGTPTITPGSMGTGTYLGRGLGNPASFSSCSHGAGRALSRGRARRELSLAGQLALVRQAGGEVFADSREAVLDEMPGAYKDLEEVMAAQADLVEPVRRFTPLATYKGSDSPRRRRPHKRRPEEER